MKPIRIAGVLAVAGWTMVGVMGLVSLLIWRRGAAAHGMVIIMSGLLALATAAKGRSALRVLRLVGVPAGPNRGRRSAAGFVVGEVALYLMTLLVAVGALIAGLSRMLGERFPLFD